VNAEFIDVHDELAKARVTRFHWRLGATMGALTLFDGYDTFNPAHVIHYVLAAMKSQARASRPPRLEWTHRVSDRRSCARPSCRPRWPTYL